MVFCLRGIDQRCPVPARGGRDDPDRAKRYELIDLLRNIRRRDHGDVVGGAV
jgi:hypothetical protein